MAGVPAGAGSVHPRGRGEHVKIVSLKPAVDGSSPRGRGTRVCCRHRHPAAPVHPRGAGNVGPPIEFHGPAAGSSPRARGTLQRMLGPGPPRRFIPAGAGNAGWVADRGSLRSGSSPRARGTATRRRPHVAGSAVHPRGGGERPGPARCGPWPAVHPRGRGELVLIPQPVDSVKSVHPRGGGELGDHHWRGEHGGGSSPRARGTLCAGHASLFKLMRFIPAGAGNS